MLVDEIWTSLKKATGTCDEAENYRLLNLAIDVLANKKLVDPMLATLDFYADGGYFFALPRDVKTPIKINLNNNPAFARSRIFEFAQNTDGTVDGPEVGWSWSDRGYLPIQDERKLPARLKYASTEAIDDGRTVKVFGKDGDGREIMEVLTADSIHPQLSENIFSVVDRVIRELTTAECLLQTETEENIARYYGDERMPEYRVIKLSQKAVACRMLYRKHVFKISSQEDVIPLRSQLALLQAVKGVILMEAEDPAAEHYFAKAKEFLDDEQATRDENTSATDGMEVQTATNANISTRDSVIMADVYDTAAEIFGPIGRGKIFDRTTDALEALANKNEWDALRGAVDLWTSDRSRAVTPKSDRGDGYFVLPRIVESILAVNYDSSPAIPRNRWSEFHVNGTGERYKAPVGKWDEMGETVILNDLPLDPTTKKVIPHRLIAIPESSADDGVEIVVEGVERLSDGSERVVWRNGQKGFTVPCIHGGQDTGENPPNWVRIDRIRKGASQSFIKLYAVHEETLSVAAVGDMGYEIGVKATDAVEKLIKEGAPSDLILLGDINYLGDTAASMDAAVGARWRPFIHPFQGSPTNAPLKAGETDATANHCYPVAGNHDWDMRNLATYLDYFQLPHNERYYSFTLGPVQFFALSSDPREPDGTIMGSVQHAWLAEQVAASTARWKVAIFHHPPYTSGSTHGAREELRWNFRELGINLVLTGHNHHYERWEQDEVAYLTVGTGSPTLYGFKSSTSGYSKKRLQVNGALFLSIIEGRLRATFKGVDGIELDRAEISPTAEPRENILLGYYEPDETEPRYRIIKVSHSTSQRIRVLYRRRSLAIRNMHDLLHLKSRNAIINALRALKAEETDPQAAANYMATATNYLKEQEWALAPAKGFSLQVDRSTWPGGFENVS